MLGLIQMVPFKHADMSPSLASGLCLQQSIVRLPAERSDCTDAVVSVSSELQHRSRPTPWTEHAGRSRDEDAWKVHERLYDRSTYMYLLLKIHGHSKNESTSVIRLDKHSTLRTTWYWVRVGIGYKL